LRHPGRSANGRAVLAPLRGFPGPNLPVQAFTSSIATLSGDRSPSATGVHPTELRAQKTDCILDALRHRAAILPYFGAGSQCRSRFYSSVFMRANGFGLSRLDICSDVIDAH